MMQNQNQRKFCIQVGGGLGDQLNAEPVIRFMKTKWMKADDIALMTHYPDFFSHLDVQCFDKGTQFPDVRMSSQTHPNLDQLDKEPVCFHRIHPVDYIAIRLLRRTLPLAFKNIQLVADARHLEKMNFYLAGNRPKTVLIHPGLGWASKTFSADSWNSYIEALQKKGYFVVVIGKQFSYSGEPHGTVPGVNPGNWDARDQLSLRDLIALISLAPVLISNDSGPVHIAGAFNNWIGLISSCKDPSYVLPFRHGGQVFRAATLEEYRAYDFDFDFDPLMYIDVPIQYLSDEKKALVMPSVEKVLSFTDHAMREFSKP